MAVCWRPAAADGLDTVLTQTRTVVSQAQFDVAVSEMVATEPAGTSS